MDRSLVASARAVPAVKNILIYNLLLPLKTVRAAARIGVFLTGHLLWHDPNWERHALSFKILVASIVLHDTSMLSNLATPKQQRSTFWHYVKQY